MKYKSFTIENYRAIKKPACIALDKRIIPLIGINECGKTTILHAIFCFDYLNDKEISGKHLLETQNLYETDNHAHPTITAEIECDKKDLLKALDNVPKNEYTECLSDILQAKTKFAFKITRDLIDKQYSIDALFNDGPSDFQNSFCKEIISYLPYILYNDDFNDRPEDIIIIPDPEKEPVGWAAIFDRVFKLTNPAYSLTSILNEKEKTRRSIMSDVTDFLNSEITKEWSKFVSAKEKISTELSIEPDNKSLKISIVDELNGKKRWFNVSDRSKGFIWHYNFIMKVRFNPKHVSDNIEDTIFLLDEPGSYLHEALQANLCAEIKKISSKEGIVIYCTHSPKLLDIKHIPYNNISIVDKSKKGYITVNQINHCQTTAKKNTAMQPVYEALMIPEYKPVFENEKMICVEGIHDRYVIELFCKINQDIRIIASMGATSIVNNIQYLIAYKIPYIAIWDNDKDGQDGLKKARAFLGEIESQKLFVLPLPDKGRMEEMIFDDDKAMIAQKLNLDSKASYESIIAGLYSCSNKKAILQKITKETRDNFQRLNKIIQENLI